MSTLTSSASPAASPRLKYRPSSRAARSPRSNVPPSPPTSSNNLADERVSGAAAAAAVQQTLQSHLEHRYVDVGTQYSPEGYPPTAAPDRIVPFTRAGSKRKPSQERAPSGIPSSSMAVETTRPSPPAAPIPRKVPTDNEARTGDDPSQKEDGNTVTTTQATSATDYLKRPRTDSRGLKIMPRKYETCDPMDLGVLIADMLLELIRLNDKIPLKDGKLTRFHSRAPPGISCHDYLKRLIQHATLSPPILLSMVFYIDKLCNMYPAFTIGSLTVHRFLITAATVASKGLSDSFWTNPTYARIGGISTSELATLELDFLERVDFRIVPKPETLVDYYNSLVQRSQDYRLEDESPGSTPESDKMETDPT